MAQIHLSTRLDAERLRLRLVSGRGRIACSTRAVRDAMASTRPEDVDCQRCRALLQRRQETGACQTA